MNIMVQAIVDSVSPAMRDSVNLALIDRICRAYESAQNDDAGFAAEIMRVIRAVAVDGRVTILSDGLAAELLKTAFPKDQRLWSIVSVEDDSVPASVR